MKAIEETSTITATGQTTVPKAVRQALGVDYGGKITFRIGRGRVTVHNPQAEDRDPVLAAFLALLGKDIAAGRNIGDMPPRLLAEMRRVMSEVPVDLDEALEGSGSHEVHTRSARKSAALRTNASNRRRRGR